MVNHKNVLRKLISFITKNKEIIASIESKDTQKPIEQSICEVEDGVKVLEYYNRLQIQMKVVSESGTTYRVPLGNALFILPFNYPFLLACWKIGPALATGNSCWIKPSPYAPNSIKYVLDEINEPNIIKCVLATNEETLALVKNPNVHHIGFIGGQEAAQIIWRNAYGKSIGIEASGCNAIVVDEDVPKNAVETITDAVLTNAGQNCCKPSHIFIPKSKIEELVPKLQFAFSRYPLIPLINDIQKSKYIKNIEFLDNSSFTLLPIDSSTSPFSKNSSFVPPKLFLYNKTRPSPYFYNEIFGPVTIIIPYSSVTQLDAIIMPNTNKLAFGVLSTNPHFAHNLIHKYHHGINWVNQYNICYPDLCFGGALLSGSSWHKDLGIEAAHGLTKQFSVVEK